MDINEYGLFVVFDDPNQPTQVIDLPILEAWQWTVKKAQTVGFHLHGSIVLHVAPGYSHAEEGEMEHRVPPKYLRVAKFGDDQSMRVVAYLAPQDDALNLSLRDFFYRFYQPNVEMRTWPVAGKGILFGH